MREKTKLRVLKTETFFIVINGVLSFLLFIISSTTVHPCFQRFPLLFHFVLKHEAIKQSAKKKNFILSSLKKNTRNKRLIVIPTAFPFFPSFSFSEGNKT